MLSRVLTSEMRQNPTNLGRKTAIIIQVLTKQVSGEDAGSADHIKPALSTRLHLSMVILILLVVSEGSGSL